MRETLAKVVAILREKPIKQIVPDSYFSRRPQMKTLPKDAFFCRKEQLPIGEAFGKISSCWIKKVPPGSPILIPGEEITQWHLDKLSVDTFTEIVKE